jgi:hypothetical protein
MKKIVALVIVGAFALTLGVLLRAYAYPKLAVVPSDLDSRVVAQSLPDSPATYFSIADLAEKTESLRNISSARVDSKASEEVSDELGTDVLVIKSYACTDLATVDCQTASLPLSGAISTFALDKKTGNQVAWDGASIETGGEVETGVEFEGLTIKFPFNAQKKTYQFWNADLRTSVPVTYEGEEKLQGLKVYRYKQTLTPTAVSKLDLPGDLVGSDEGTVTADRVASGTTEYYVEPETGVIMSAVSSPNSYAEVDGQKILTITKGTFQSPDSTIADTVDEYKPLAKALFGIRVVAPIAGPAVGLLCFVAAGVLWARRSRRDASIEAGATGRRRETVDA